VGAVLKGVVTEPKSKALAGREGVGVATNRRRTGGLTPLLNLRETLLRCVIEASQVPTPTKEEKEMVEQILTVWLKKALGAQAALMSLLEAKMVEEMRGYCRGCSRQSECWNNMFSLYAQASGHEDIFCMNRND